MSRLAILLGVSLMLLACSGGTAATPTTAPASVAPTLAAPLATLPPVATPAATAVPIPTGAPSGPPASGEVGSQGDKIEVSGYQFITLAESEYTTDGYTDFFKPDEGNVIYAFNFEFEGIDPDGSSVNPLYFNITIDSVEYTASFLGGKEPTLPSGELQPGATSSGWVSFNAPLAERLVLKYEPVMGLAGNTVQWNVEVRQ